MPSRSARYDAVTPKRSTQLCSSGGTAWLVSCPPSQSNSSVSTTRRPARSSASAAATPPRPPPMTTTSVWCGKASSSVSRRCAERRTVDERARQQFPRGGAVFEHLGQRLHRPPPHLAAGDAEPGQVDV